MRDNRLARLLFAEILAAMFCATCAKDESLPHPRFEVTEDVVFARTYREDGASVDRVMDVLRPVDDSSQARPALLCLHGNPGQQPYPGGRQHHFRDYAEYFAARGYVCFVVAWGFDSAPLVQIKAAVRHVRADASGYGVDPERIGAIGHSYGGSLAIALAVTGEDHGQPSDVERADLVNHPGVSSQIRATAAIPGGVFYPEECDIDDAPIFYARGTLDKGFHIPEDRVAELEARNVSYAWFPVEGAEHAIDSSLQAAFGRTLPELMSEFFALHLCDGRGATMTMLHTLHDGAGKVSAAPFNRLAPANTKTTLTAKPEPGNRFVRWEGDLTGTDNPTEISMDASKRITAVFAPASTSPVRQER